MEIASSDLYSYVSLPLLIFFARMTDVTLMTLRIIFVSRGKRYLAPLLGFVEVFIWIAVVSQIIRGANNLVAYLAYAAGFAAGSYVGIYIENRLAIGTLVVRAIIPRGADELVARLHSAGRGRQRCVARHRRRARAARGRFRHAGRRCGGRAGDHRTRPARHGPGGLRHAR